MSRREKTHLHDTYIQYIYEDSSEEVVSDLLMHTGLLNDRSIEYVGSLDKLVFTLGNQNEIYTRQELGFISQFHNVIVFSKFYKNIARGIIPCRVIAVKMDCYDAVYGSIGFTKIINKAIEGFNICCLITDEGLIFTCVSFDEQSIYGYYMSEIINTKERYDIFAYELTCSPMSDYFVDYYMHIRDVLMQRSETANEYEDIYDKNAYIEDLRALEGMFGLDFSKEIDRCSYGYDELSRIAYDDRIKECEESIFDIQSTRVNTMEMLFEAEELEQLAVEVDKQNRDIIESTENNVENYIKVPEQDLSELLSDPEKMIKMLKRMKGI